MLEYNKQILQKVSFNKALFVKELKKGFQYLNDTEKNIFKKWCIKQYSIEETYINNLI